MSSYLRRWRRNWELSTARGARAQAGRKDSVHRRHRLRATTRAMRRWRRKLERHGDDPPVAAATLPRERRWPWRVALTWIRRRRARLLSALWRWRDRREGRA